MWCKSVLVFGLVALGSLVLAWVFLHSGRDPDNSRSAGSKGGFEEAARRAGLHSFRMAFLPDEQGEKFKTNLYDHGCGVAIADFDGDGFEDIYLTNQLGPNALFKNQGDGTFVDVARGAGVELGDRVCVGATFADFNNDGLADLFVTSIRGGNVLFQNLGKGKFKEVTKEAGLSWMGHSQTAAFFDFDNDGLLDLFVTNTARWTESDLDSSRRYYPGVADLWVLVQCPKEYNILYRNNGDGTFTDVTAKAGVKGQGWGGDVAVFDYDDDGYQDLLVTNMFGRSQLFHNNRDGTFSDVASTILGRTSFGAIGSKAFDFNNDGKLDLLIVDMHSDMWTTYSSLTLSHIAQLEKKKFKFLSGPVEAASWQDLHGMEFEKKLADVFQLRYDEVLFGNTLFKNLGHGKFEEVSGKAGMETFWPWGIASGDFDNDGYEDVFLPSGMGHPFFYWPNRLMMNNGNETFSERSQQEGVEPPPQGIFLEEKLGNKDAARSSRCAAVADFRNSGRLDIITNNFNDHPYFFQNRFPKKNYISFRLQGTKSNRDAIGALVRLCLGKEVMVRQVHAAGGYLSHSSRLVHFGLGDRTGVDRATIIWPSGIRQEISHPDMNKLHAIVEPPN